MDLLHPKYFQEEPRFADCSSNFLHTTVLAVDQIGGSKGVVHSIIRLFLRRKVLWLTLVVWIISYELEIA